MVEQREHGLIQADEKMQSQEQQLIEQNMKIEELQKALKVRAVIILSFWIQILGKQCRPRSDQGLQCLLFYYNAESRTTTYSIENED